MKLTELRKILLALDVEMKLSAKRKMCVVTLVRGTVTIVCADQDLERAADRAIARFIESTRKNPTTARVS